MIRAATWIEIITAFLAEPIRLGRPMTDAEVMELAQQLGREIERDDTHAKEYESR
jgi:hypothetical protein